MKLFNKLIIKGNGSGFTQHLIGCDVINMLTQHFGPERS